MEFYKICLDCEKEYDVLKENCPECGSSSHLTSQEFTESLISIWWKGLDFQQRYNLVKKHFPTFTGSIDKNMKQTLFLKEKESRLKANSRLFLEPENMKVLGFDLISSKDGYLKYQNDGTKHRNKDYNKNFPEPKGKVFVFVNFNYSDIPFIGIEQDGGTRPVYNGICETEQFLITLLNSIR